MTAIYTFDVFSSLDGYGAPSGNWGGYWGKQGPELLDHRLAAHPGRRKRSRSYFAHRRTSWRGTATETCCPVAHRLTACALLVVVIKNGAVASFG